MLWSNSSTLTSTWAANAQYGIENGATALLGFNEPDLCVPGSACMSLNSSVTAWKQYMEPFAGKALLGSPAVTNGGSTGTDYMGADYLNYFIGNCTGCHIDFVNMHWVRLFCPTIYEMLTKSLVLQLLRWCELPQDSGRKHSCCCGWSPYLGY